MAAGIYDINNRTMSTPRDTGRGLHCSTIGGGGVVVTGGGTGAGAGGGLGGGVVGGASKEGGGVGISGVVTDQCRVEHRAFLDRQKLSECKRKNRVKGIPLLLFMSVYIYKYIYIYIYIYILTVYMAHLYI